MAKLGFCRWFLTRCVDQTLDEWCRWQAAYISTHRWRIPTSRATYTEGLLWPQIISHLHGIVENSLEYFPWHFLAGFGQSAPVDRLCLRPKPAVPCVAKERSYVVIHAVVIAIGHHR